MKRFLVSSSSAPALKRSNSTKSHQGNVSASERANEFNGHFYADGGNLFCKHRNICVDHVRISTVKDHVESKTHQRKKTEMIERKNKSEKRLKTVTSMIKSKTKENNDRKSSYIELVEAFTKANIPLYTLDSEPLRDYLSSHVQGLGLLPTSGRLRRDYLPFVKELHEKELYSMFQKASGFIIS